eukprot:TRINITY_DN3787_c0_g2_i1.p2 TRINITY_DN3787_c0_g2~~TRINITY_DN3787_c0_g2_i1.p2  ORF type:complete len:122 (-),score=26.65 TRINITY_DN3787_c0_g2_i1:368-733(-)
MLITSRRRKATKSNNISLPTRFVQPNKNPLYSFDILTRIATFCSDDTLCSVVEVCQYFRSALTLQPLFEARIWKARHAQLLLKYRELMELRTRQAEEEKRARADVNAALISSRQLHVSLHA